MKRYARTAIASLAVVLVMLASLMGPLPVEAQTGTAHFEHISLEQGLSENSVNVIFQDSSGFMWFGTRDGLNKYDGYGFTVYRYDPNDPNSLSGSSILSICEDRSGALWIGTYGAGLNRFDRAAGTFTRYRHDPDDEGSLGGDTVLAVYSDRNDTIWAGTATGGLDRYDPAQDGFIHYRHHPNDPYSLSSDSVRVIYEDRAKRLWVGTHSGLNRLNRATGQVIRYQYDPEDTESLSGPVVISLCEDRYGALWIATNFGVAVLDRDTGDLKRYGSDPSTGVPGRDVEVLVRYQHDPGDPGSLGRGAVSSVATDRYGDVWIGMSGPKGGLDRLDRARGTFVHYSHNASNPHSLAANDVRSVFFDRGGVLWVGTYGGGISKLNPATEVFQHYWHDPQDTNSLSHNAVFALCEDQDGLLWIGTRGGGLDCLDRRTGVFRHYRNDAEDSNSLSGDIVYAIHEDREGELWIGTDNGLDRYDRASDSFVRYLSGSTVRAILADRAGILWIGTHEGLLGARFAEGEVVHYEPDPHDERSLSDHTVLAICEDRYGVLWIGTATGGLCRFDRASAAFTTYGCDPDDPSTLSHSGVLSIYEDRRGQLWVGTITGLNMLNRGAGTFQRYSVGDGLPNDWIHGIVGDESGNLWLSTNKGLSRFSFGSPVPSFRNFDVGDGLQSDGFNTGAAHRSRSGELFFGGVNGFNAFYPDRIETNFHIPQMVITAFKKLNLVVLTDLSRPEEIELSYRDKFISFEFAALDYSAPEKNQYTCQLEGFDQDWIPCGTRRYKSYTNLGGGQYVFRIRGSNNDGVWGTQGLAIPITVTPPIWDTWWFRAIAALALLGGILGGYRYRVRTIEVRNQELAAQVDERTYEIERRRQVAEGLREILIILNSDRSLTESLDYIVSQATLLTGAAEAMVFRREGDDRAVIVSGQLRALATRTKGETAARESVCATEMASSLSDLPGPVVEWIARSQGGDQPLVVSSLGEHGPNGQSTGKSLASDRGAILGVPLSVGQELYGGLVLYYPRQKEFSEEDLDLANMFTDQAALAIANDQLRDRAEETAAASERNRLARDLHDAVTQTLFSASLIAEILPTVWENDQSEARELTDELRRLSRGALAEMRTLLLELRPTTLIEADLGDLLRQLGEMVTGRTAASVAVEVEGQGQLPPDVRVALYRIAQEALNNVVKHASASEVSICLRYSASSAGTAGGGAGRAELSVKDDGRGFDADAIPPDHLGLSIMRERVDALGGEVVIQSQPGQGTRITVDWTGGA